MFAIPPYFLLAPYALLLLVMSLLGLMNIVNLLKYGARNAVGFLATFLFLCGLAVIMFFTWQRLMDVDWQSPVKILASDPALFH